MNTISYVLLTYCNLAYSFLLQVSLYIHALLKTRNDVTPYYKEEINQFYGTNDTPYYNLSSGQEMI
jgi:hypothetical protein